MVTLNSGRCRPAILVRLYSRAAATGDRRGRELGPVGERVGADRLLLLLHVDHALVDDPQPLDWVVDVGGEEVKVVATRLPSAPFSSSDRTETGTIATSGPSGDSPFASRYRRRAPAQRASTTSFTVEPVCFLRALTVGRDSEVVPARGDRRVERRPWRRER